MSGYSGKYGPTGPDRCAGGLAHLRLGRVDDHLETGRFPGSTDGAATDLPHVGVIGRRLFVRRNAFGVCHYIPHRQSALVANYCLTT